MFAVAFLIGIFGYLIFLLGVMHLLYIPIIFGMIILILFLLFLTGNYYLNHGYKFQFRRLSFKIDRLSFLVMSLLTLLALLYLSGALVPELAFDALWYHLTLPKIYLMNHSITHIPGGLLYYSDMPKLTEMLYTVVLALGNEIWAKIIHFIFGLLVAAAIYLCSRKYMSQKFALLASLIFYSNLVVAWESTTAYIDLTRTFFEFMALWGFLNFIETKKKTWMIESAALLGLAISTKLISVGSILIFLSLIWIYMKDMIVQEKLKLCIEYIIIACIIPLPWFVFAYLNTGNPLYPLFTPYYSVATGLNPLHMLLGLWDVFVHANDPISPIYIITFPLVLLFFAKMKRFFQVIAWYSLCAIVVWVLTPNTGGGRFMLVYLPAFSILVSYIISLLKDSYIYKLLVLLVIMLSITTFFYRLIAQSRYFPYLLGRQTKSEFLSTHLNFNYGDFYDVDGYFKGRITKKDMVLVYGIHNLYYINFPFVDSTYIQPGTAFDYILVGKDAVLPKRFQNWNLIYQNTTTHVKLYNFQGQSWIY